MIKINKITRGRFGNKILQYNSAYQMSCILQTDLYCTNWEGNAIFDLPTTNHINPTREEKSITWRECTEPSWSHIKQTHDTFDLNLDDPSYMLHNVFFQLTCRDPRKVFRINDKYQRNLPADKVNVGIHLRGTDILGADGNHGREIHGPEYYKLSIDLIESKFPNIQYYVCTDDVNFDSYKETIKYLGDRGCSFETGDVNDYIADFVTLTQCDVLVASSSTFVMCAVFIGKENKKVVHSKEWIDKNINHLPWHTTKHPDDVRKMQLSFDDFWIRLYNEGNQFYKIWRLI